MPGLTEPRGKTGDVYAESEPDALDELDTQVLTVRDANEQELPPTLVGAIDDGLSGPRRVERRDSEPLVFYVEDQSHKRLRVAAVVLFVMLIGLVMLGNGLYGWEPLASQPSPDASKTLTNGTGSAVAPVPVGATDPSSRRNDAASEGSGAQKGRSAEELADRIARSAARYGKADLISIPPGAEVFLDGYRVGRTPLRGVQLPAGSYGLELRRAGQTQLLEVDIRSGERVEAKASF